jgi:hypothetical protein
MDSYQILVFENQRIYDSFYVSAENPVEEYVNKCATYMPRPNVLPENTRFISDKTWVKYSHKKGGKKPLMVMMIGPTTPEMIDSIQQKLKRIYIDNCEICGKDIDFRHCVCRECWGPVPCSVEID